MNFTYGYKKFKLTEISTLPKLPTDGKIYLFKGVRVPCPDCENCAVSRYCKFNSKLKFKSYE